MAHGYTNVAEHFPLKRPRLRRSLFLSAHTHSTAGLVMSQKRSRREYEADARRQLSPFVIYGTPLPPLDENTRDDGSYVPLWKQEVTDDRGRKRLHGAFTGGFSAG